MDGSRVLTFCISVTSLVVAGCQHNPVVCPPVEYPRPPVELMQAPSTQYLLPPELRKTAPKKP